MSEFAFHLGQQVYLALPSTMGTVIGRADFSSRPSDYLIRYMSGFGQVEVWFAATALTAA